MLNSKSKDGYLIRVSSWEDFEKQVDLFTNKTKRLRKGGCEWLWRGQSNAKWTLATTLERFCEGEYSAQRYLESIHSAAQAVESVTGKKWEVPLVMEEDRTDLPPPSYHFMAFLRQNGFPSPLLDWSRSFYIAGFFAFRDAHEAKSKEVAIYAFLDRVGTEKTGSLQEPRIAALGRWIGTDKKHFLQQSEYTVCRKKTEQGIVYTKHEQVFGANPRPGGQDMLTKFLLPVSERNKVMKKLKEMNINAYSLFESTEALLSLLAEDVLKS